MTAISFSDIWFRYSQGNFVLSGATGNFEAGKKTALIGPDGSGKSTLLKILAGLLKCERGAITGVPDDLEHSGGGRHREGRVAGQEIGLLFPEGALFDSLSVFDNVAFPLVDGRVPSMTLPLAERKVVHDKVEIILSAVGLSAHSEKLPGQLSGGMRRRVALARALVGRPPVLLLDDPTAGLDPVASQVIMQLIERMHAEYHPTTVLVSHDLRRLLPISDEIVAMFNGQVIYNGPRNLLAASAPLPVNEFLACRGGFK